MRDTFEPTNTVQFTFVSSVAPDSAPVLKVSGVQSGTVIASLSATSSDTTNYYSLFTLPSSEGVYMGEWFSQKTFSGSAHNFVKRFLFNVKQTRQEL